MYADISMFFFTRMLNMACGKVSIRREINSTITFNNSVIFVSIRRIAGQLHCNNIYTLINEVEKSLRGLARQKD